MTKQTFLHDEHIALGARMVDFAGWEMPVQYKSIIEEHNTVRNAVGLFDVSHMGEIIISGTDACNFLNHVVPQNIDNLTDGKAVYCQLTNCNAGIIDDLIIYKLEDNKYLIIANASRIDEDINWLARNKQNYNINITDESFNYSMIAVQGPNTLKLLGNMQILDVPSFFSIKAGFVNNIPIWISRTGYTGEDGVELIMKNEYACEVWQMLLEKGQSLGVQPIGLGARDTLRLEATMPLYGHELDENTTPIEACLSWSIPKDKQTYYNGKNVIMQQLQSGVTKKRVGLKMTDKAIARNGYDVYFDNNKIGTITSGCVSPTRGDNIALAMIKKTDNLSVGSVIQVMIRNKLYNAEIVKLPFISKRNK